MVEYGGKGLQSKPGAGIRGAQGCLGVRNVIVNGVEVRERVMHNAQSNSAQYNNTQYNSTQSTKTVRTRVSSP